MTSVVVILGVITDNDSTLAMAPPLHPLPWEGADKGAKIANRFRFEEQEQAASYKARIKWVLLQCSAHLSELPRAGQQ